MKIEATNHGDMCRLILSTGREFQAQRGIIGINNGVITGGFSSVVDAGAIPVFDERGNVQEMIEPFTDEERLEIAEYVLSVWGDFAGYLRERIQSKLVAKGTS